MEATLFATLMSILNGGAFAGSALGSALTAALGVTADDFRLLWVLVAVCQLSSLLPLPLLWCRPVRVWCCLHERAAVRVAVAKGRP